MNRYAITMRRLLFCFLIGCGMQLPALAQPLVSSPYQMTLLHNRTHTQMLVRLAHNFPDFVRMRVIYAYFDGSSTLHKLSVVLQGYHKVWSLRPMPAAADKLQFLSFSIEYGDYQLRLEEGAGTARLLKNNVVLDSAIAVNLRPLQPLTGNNLAIK